jgi:hypothetical protein
MTISLIEKTSFEKTAMVAGQPHAAAVDLNRHAAFFFIDALACMRAMRTCRRMPAARRNAMRHLLFCKNLREGNHPGSPEP